MDKNKKRMLIKQILNSVKPHDVGEKIQECTDCVGPSIGNKDIIYPNLYLSVNQLPELREYEVDEELKMVIIGKITGHSLREKGDKSEENFDISIKKIACLED